MSSVERTEITQKEVLMMSDTVPVEIQERLEALEARRLEIISENAVDRSVAEYAVARIAERKSEKSRLKIEARALRMAVDAYAAQAVEVEDLDMPAVFDLGGLPEDLPDVPVVVRSMVPEIAGVEQPEKGAKEPLLKERILRLLKENDGALTRSEIANATCEDPDRISTELSHMKRRKLVAHVEGHGWSLP